MSNQVTSNPNIIPLNSWYEFVNGHPDGSVFQSPCIVDFYRSVENHEPVVVAAFEGKNILGILVAVIIKENLGYISSRAIVYGGPLIHQKADNKREILNAILEELLRAIKHKCIYIQFRNFFDYSEYRDVFKQNGFRFIEWSNIKVRISTEEENLKKLSSSKRRQIRKALTHGVKIAPPENIEQLLEFYVILKNLYKKKVKKPLPSFSFFEEFYLAGTKNKLGVYRLVLFERKVIGGIMIPVTSNKTAYEWYVGGLDEKYKQQYPSVVATWAAIKYSFENKLESFDFMGAGSPDTDYGVREFKSKFGGEQVNFGRFERINNQLVYHFAKIGLKIVSPVLSIFR